MLSCDFPHPSRKRDLWKTTRGNAVSGYRAQAERLGRELEKRDDEQGAAQES